MSIAEEVHQAIIAAMKAKEQVRLDVARMTKSALKNREIEAGGSLDEVQARQVVATMIKQRRDAAEQFRAGQREELAKKEEEEIVFLAGLMPPQLSEAEIVKQVDQSIAELNAAGPGDMGKVMKPVMAALAGQADGSTVKRIVQERLSK